MRSWQLDPLHLFLAASTINLVFALAVGIIACVDRRARGMKWFSASSFMLLTSTTFRLWHARNESPIWDVRISAWVLLSYALMSIGVYWFCERRPVRHARMKVLLLLGVCGLALLVPGKAAFPIFALLRGVTCAILLWCGWMFWRPRVRALRKTTRISAVIVVMLAILLMLFPVIKLGALTPYTMWLLDFLRSAATVCSLALQLSFVSLYVMDNNTRLLEETRRDVLTGLHNRRAFEEQAQISVDHAVTRDQSLALLMIDLDDFKALNDRWGHSCGDQSLKLVGGALRGALSNEKLAARIGGEEFAVLLENCDLERAKDKADGLRELIESLELYSGANRITITASIGVSLLLPGEVVWHDLLQRADAALYGAKSRGRNCVVVSSDTTAPLPAAGETSAWNRIFRGGLSL
ncbi:GGDEF domain-containing protein [Granulicella cerasi]|uniref:diguanylate cyclase n=1 Tax=Granulicella cerasi TaxID=741063 RepID=A0ABW1Z903_9BACT|nr:GGDEF domain-containing protein [Granulicella cerasi]